MCRYRDRQEVFSKAIKVLVCFSTDSATLQQMSTQKLIWGRVRSIIGILERKNKLNAKLASKGKAAALVHADATKQIKLMQDLLQKIDLISK